MRWLLPLVAVALSVACTAAPMPATGSVEAVFSPWDDVEGALMRAIGSAKKSIRVQAFLFTSKPLAQALIDAHRRGIDVSVLADREMVVNGNNSQIPRLAAAGIPVWLEVRYAAAHNKIILIDPTETDSIVITGSFNYTYSAQARNAENVVILRGNPELARIYLKNWQRHRAEAQAFAAEKPAP